jgi:hypothetical protein
MYWIGTILSAVLIYVLGQLLVKLIEPALALRTLIGRIAGDLIMYANRDPKIASDDERYKLFRRHASDVFQGSATVLCYGFFAWLSIVPKKADLERVGRLLISLSNVQFDVGRTQNEDGDVDVQQEMRVKINERLWEVTVQEIRQKLKITEPDPPCPSMEAIDEAIKRGTVHL